MVLSKKQTVTPHRHASSLLLIIFQQQHGLRCFIPVIFFLNQSSKSQANNISEIIIFFISCMFCMRLYIIVYKHELWICHRADDNSSQCNVRTRFCVFHESHYRNGRLYLPGHGRIRCCLYAGIYQRNNQDTRPWSQGQASVTVQKHVSPRFLILPA